MKRLPFSAAILMLASIAAPAHADDILYKCMDGKGAVSIQSDPCPKNSKEVWKRDPAAMAAAVKTLPPQANASVTGAPPPRPPQAPKAPKAGPPGPHPPAPPTDGSLDSASVESLAPIGPGAPAVPPPIDPCDHAKDIAAQLRDMAWLELSSDQQQKLMGWVMQQCRQGSSEQN